MRVVVFQHRRSALILGVKPIMEFSESFSGTLLPRVKQFFVLQQDMQDEKRYL